MAGELIGDALLGVARGVCLIREVQEIITELKDEGALSARCARTSSLRFAPQFSLVSAHAEQLAAYLKLAVWALGVERPAKFLLVRKAERGRPSRPAARSVPLSHYNARRRDHEYCF